MKIALVHDYLVQNGGAENVLEAFSEIWPYAPIYTLVYDKDLMHGRFGDKTIRTSYLQKVPFSRKYHRIFPPLMLSAIEQFDFSYYDVVLSDSSSFAKNIITDEKTFHISYCHTPMRYGWDDCQQYTKEFGFPGFVKKITPFFMNYIRMSDFYGSNGVDVFLANSSFVAKRIKKYYHRSSVVINPPVDVDNFYISKKENVGDYYLLVGRMMKYKKMDLVIKAFNEMKKPLKVVGRGVEFENLKKIAGSTIEFTGRVSDDDLKKLYSEAKAFIFPQEEDFGIVAIEALASGRPVIAYRAGDIVEHLVEGKSGLFFDEQTVSGLISVVLKFEKIEFNSEFIRSTAVGFEKNNFKKRIKKSVEDSFEDFKKIK